MRRAETEIDLHQRRSLDRTRIRAQFSGACRGCNQQYPVGTSVTPVKGLGGSTLWAHWQPDLACAKAADAFIRSHMANSARNKRAQ